MKTTLTVKDFDGRPFYFVGPTTDHCEAAHRKLNRIAHRHGCLLREVPTLGTHERGPWHRDFTVTYTDGVVTGITERPGTAARFMRRPGQ